VVGTSIGTQHKPDGGDEDLVPLGDLIRQTPGAHPIRSADELRCDAFDTEEELDDFLTFISESRRVGLA
jgi:hypothetical protein